MKVSRLFQNLMKGSRRSEVICILGSLGNKSYVLSARKARALVSFTKLEVSMKVRFIFVVFAVVSSMIGELAYFYKHGLGVHWFPFIPNKS